MRPPLQGSGADPVQGERAVSAAVAIIIPLLVLVGASPPAGPLAQDGYPWRRHTLRTGRIGARDSHTCGRYLRAVDEA